MWVDTETNPKQLTPSLVSHHLKFGWALYSRTRRSGKWIKPVWFRFNLIDTFWSWIEQLARPKTRIYLFAHNWSFDGCVLDIFNQLPNRGWKLNRCVIEAPPIILSWRKDSRTIIILDTLNWWRMPLFKIGESIGIPKKPMPAQTASKRVWDTYCKRDVTVIHRAITAWWNFLTTHDLGGFAPTLASQAFRTFRHRFMSHPILIDTNAPSLELARSSLHGGRVECYRLGKVEGPIHVLDVNSMYPAVMCDNLFPTVQRLHTRSATLEEVSDWTTRYSVIARCFLQTSRPRFAHVVDGKLLFPVGRFVESLTTPDLTDAFAHGEIKGISETCIYDAAPIFNSYVTTLYRLRQNARSSGNTVQSWLLKILMNSLFGKFAQRGEVWETVGECDPIEVARWVERDHHTGMVTSWRKFGGVLQRRFGLQESSDSHPAIASHVTAYARRVLWNLMQIAGVNECVYVDTDSLFVTEEGRKPLDSFIRENELGALKHEKTENSVWLFGPKDYVLGSKRVIKGIRDSAVWTDSATVTQDKWSSLVGSIHSGNLSAPTTERITKHLSREYTKGIVARDGTVLPIRLSEW